MVLKGSYFEETLDFNKRFLGLKRIAHRQVKCAGRVCERGGYVCIGSIYTFKKQKVTKLIFFSKIPRFFY